VREAGGDQPSARPSGLVPSTDHPRFAESVDCAAHHRSLSSWVINPGAVRTATLKKLTAPGTERYALNDWLIAHPDATADDAGKAYAEDAIPGTERYKEPDHCVRRAPDVGRMFQNEEEAKAFYDNLGKEITLPAPIARNGGTGRRTRTTREIYEADVRTYRELGEDQNADELQAKIDAGWYDPGPNWMGWTRDVDR
jgi:hypothetical protein